MIWIGTFIIVRRFSKVEGIYTIYNIHNLHRCSMDVSLQYGSEFNVQNCNTYLVRCLLSFIVFSYAYLFLIQISEKCRNSHHISFISIFDRSNQCLFSFSFCVHVLSFRFYQMSVRVKASKFEHWEFIGEKAQKKKNTEQIAWYL